MLGRTFDPDRPLVASSRFTAGEDVIDAGVVFDWRGRGMSEVEVLALVSAGLLVHPPVAPVASVGIAVTPSERVTVETPAQASKRRARS